MYPNTRKSISVVLILFLIIPLGFLSPIHYAHAAGTVYYVDCNASNDTGNGQTTGTAWKTIAKVNSSTFQPDDQILFNKGCTWREQLTVPSSGTAGHPITFGAYGSGVNPVISGADLESSGWSAYSTDTTIWSATDQTGQSFADQTVAGVEFRNIIKSASINSDASLIRFKLKARSSGSVIVNNASFSERSGATDDSVTTPVRIMFNNGSGNITYSTNDIWSDWLSFNIDHTKDYFIHLEYTGNSEQTAWGSAVHSYYGWSGGNTFNSTWTSDGTMNIIFLVSEIQKRDSSSTVWQKTVTTEPKQVFFNDTLGTKVNSIAAVNGANKWYWNSNILYVYSTSDPATAFTNPGIEASARYGIYFNGGSPVWGGNYVTVQDLTVVKSNGYGINVGASDHVLSGATVQRNTVQYSYDAGIFSWVPTSMSGIINILNNEVSYNGIQSGIDGTSPAPVGIEILGSDTTYGTLVQGNNIHHNYWGMELDQGSANTTVKQNTIHDNNLIGINIDRSDNNKFFDNLVYNHTNWGLRIWSATHSTVTGNAVHNNSFYNNQTGIVIEDEQTDLKIKNNILSTNTQTASAEEISMESGHTYSGLDINNNIYYRPSGTTYFKYGTTNYNFTNWKINSGQDTNSTSTDPKFTNTTGNDFSLLSTSPAIDTGANLGTTYQLGLDPASTWPSNVLTMNQNSNGSGWDIGAYVYHSSSAPTVSITAPVAGTVTGSVTVSADASVVSPATISHVQFMLDGSNLGSADTSAPYSMTWDSTSASNASHTLTAVATDTYGNTTTSSTVSVTVSNTPPVTTIPSNGPIVGSLGSYKQNTPNFIPPTAIQTATTVPNSHEITPEVSQPTVTHPYTFSRNLSLYTKSQDVQNLQKLLNSLGFTVSQYGAGSPGKETTLFGSLTYTALQKFQKSVGLPSTGYFGPMTRGYLEGR